MKYFCFFMVLLSVKQLNAQAEYFVHVDPATGALTLVDSIPGIKWIQTGPSFTTVDNVNNIYYFRGGDNANNWWLLGIDGVTGQVVTKATFPATIGAFNNFGSMEHDDSTGTLYCMAWKASESRQYFIQVDKITGQVTPIGVVYGAKALAFSESTYDQITHHYYFKGIDSLNKTRLYQINSSNGVVLASSILPSSAAVVKYKFNSTTGKMYAFYNTIPSSNQGMSLVEINPVTGAVQNTVTTYSALPGVVTFPNYHSISTLNNQLTFRFNANLATVDLSNGAIIHNPVFPTGTTTGTNVIELRYNGNSGVLYGLHWGNTQSTTVSIDEHKNHSSFTVVVFPNPVNNKATIKFNSSSGHLMLSVYDEHGRQLRNEVVDATHVVDIDRGELPAGIYFLQVEDHSGRKEIRKMIFE